MNTPTQIIVQILPLLFLVAILAARIWSGIWIARDAVARGKPGWLVSILALLIAWPLSLLVWIALRPENVRPPFDLNKYRVQ